MKAELVACRAAATDPPEAPPQRTARRFPETSGGKNYEKLNQGKIRETNEKLQFLGKPMKNQKKTKESQGKSSTKTLKFHRKFRTTMIP